MKLSIGAGPQAKQDELKLSIGAGPQAKQDEMKLSIGAGPQAKQDEMKLFNNEFSLHQIYAEAGMKIRHQLCTTMLFEKPLTSSQKKFFVCISEHI